MKQIINKNNIDYAYQCFIDAVDIGLDFTLNNEANKKHFDKKRIQELIELTVKE